MSALGSPPSQIPGHARRILAIWLGSSVVAIPLIIWVLGPQLPPGRMTSEASDQTSANIVLTAVCVPIVLLIVVYFAYSLTVFRARGGAIEDGPPIRGHGSTQTLWIVVTTVVAFALAVWGTFVLISTAHGAGGGQGPNPLAKPSDAKQALQVQVIGQQWNWTYRFPAYGNVETLQLELPVSTPIEFHVTSLDVTHSFWAYELGVKADAVPGVDNIVYVHARKLGKFQIRCAELCGLWHGHMFQTGHVVSRSDFDSWIAGQAAEKGNQKYLPTYSRSYFPEPLRRAG